MAKKLFIVTFEIDNVVLAEDREDAEKVARRASYDFVDCGNGTYFARELNRIDFVDSDLLDSMPFGADDDTTVRQWFEKLQEEKKSENA